MSNINSPETLIDLVSYLVLQSCSFPMATDGASVFPHGLRKDLLVLLRHIDTQLLHCKPCQSVKPRGLPLSTLRMCNLGSHAEIHGLGFEVHC